MNRATDLYFAFQSSGDPIGGRNSEVP